MEDEPSPNHELLSLINMHYQNFLGYIPEKTIVKETSEDKWNDFCISNNLDNKSEGIYLPRNQTAIIPKNNELSLFHEYFGHGLYCEQSLIGRKLTDLEKELLLGEEQEFRDKQFNIKELQKFREKNQIFSELQELKNKNLGMYEMFAIWTEYYLAKQFGSPGEFEKKYDLSQNQLKTSIDNLISFKNNYGDLATFYNFGLAKKTTTERVKKLLEGIYKDKINKINLALLYGSKKEFSDIDIFIIADKLESLNSNWLDVRIVSKEKFEEMIRNFDASLIGPMFESEFLMGDNNYFKIKKEQMIEQPITHESIQYNLQKGKEQRELSMSYPENSAERKHGLDYFNSYLINAFSLKNGKKILKEQDLKNEKFIELKQSIIT